MTSVYDQQGVTIHHGDCLDVLRELPDNSVDAVVTDPPYGLEFMGQDWDSFGRDTGNGYREKPRWTPDHMGKGFTSLPNHFEAGKPFQQWCEQWATECFRVLKPGGHMLAFGGTRTYHRLTTGIEDAGFEIRDSLHWIYRSGFPKSMNVSKAIDKAARGVPQGGADPTSVNHGRYKTQATEGKRGAKDTGRGFGAGPGQFMATAGEADERELVDAAKPWEGWGTAVRPSHEPIVLARKPLAGTVAANVQQWGTGAINVNASRGDGGRWPANVLISEEIAEELGDAARSFPVFHCAPKAPSSERPSVNGVKHPCVKPLSLMQWLVNLITPPGGLVLDPFAGSGTTAEACILEGLRCVAIEQRADYLPLIRQRIDRRRDTTNVRPLPRQERQPDGGQPSLLDLIEGAAS